MHGVLPRRHWGSLFCVALFIGRQGLIKVNDILPHGSEGGFFCITHPPVEIERQGDIKILYRKEHKIFRIGEITFYHQSDVDAGAYGLQHIGRVASQKRDSRMEIIVRILFLYNVEQGVGASVEQKEQRCRSDSVTVSALARG